MKLDEHIGELIEILAEGHVLYNHSYRHGVEKVQRKELLNEAFENYDFKNSTIDEFFSFYS